MYLNCIPTVLAAPMKMCSKCGEVKSFDDFYNLSKSKDGKHSNCKLCQKTANRKWHDQVKDTDEFKEKARAYQKEYYSRPEVKDRKREYQAERLADPDIRDRYQQYWRDYYHQNIGPEAKREYNRGPNGAAIERRRARDRAYYLRHKEESRIKKRNRRKIGAGKLTIEDVSAIRAAQTDKRGRLICWRCGKPITDTPHLDHWIPISKGGTNDPGNLRYMHAKCNLSKGRKHPAEIGRLL